MKSEDLLNYLKAALLGALLVWLLIVLFFPGALARYGEPLSDLLTALRVESIKAGAVELKLATGERAINEAIQMTPATLKAAGVAEDAARPIVAALNEALGDLREAQRSVGTPVAPPAAAGAVPWVIVFGADRARAATEDELKRARQRGLPGRLVIYQRQGWFRSIAEFPDRGAAQAALPAYRSLREGVFAWRADDWCPNRREAGEGLVQCD